ALVGRLSVALPAVKLAWAGGLGRLAILGCGSIGLCSALVARKLGFADVVGVDLGEFKGELARAAGVHGYVDASAGDLAHRIGTVVYGEPDVTLIASGHETALFEAAAMTRPGGTIVVVSYFERPLEVDLNSLAARGLSVQFSLLATDKDVADVIRWIEAGEIDP